MSDLHKISAADFEWIAKVIHARTGLSIDVGKEYIVESRIGPIAKRRGFSSLTMFIASLRQQPSSPDWSSVDEAMTTNETSFFRDESFFEVLERDALPAVIESARETKRLRMWCAASSSGQEVYSVLMTIRERFRELDAWQIQFVCSDLSNEMVTRVRSGVYSQLEVNRGLPAERLQRYFDPLDSNWVVKQSLRRHVDALRINLVLPLPTLPTFDIVFLRNVMIYFDAETRRGVIERVRRTLRPGGYLFVGSMESSSIQDNNLERSRNGRGGCFVHRPVAVKV